MKVSSMMQIETQVPKNKVFKTQILKTYLTLNFVTTITTAILIPLSMAANQPSY
jgi:hypothetical protein